MLKIVKSEPNDPRRLRPKAPPQTLAPISKPVNDYFRGPSTVYGLLSARISTLPGEFVRDCYSECDGAPLPISPQIIASRGNDT